MKVVRFLILCNLVLVLMSGCARTRSEICDDASSAGRYVTRGAMCLGGKHAEKQDMVSREEFMCHSNDFIPYEEEPTARELTMTTTVVRQAEQSPGDPGSPIPGIEGFRDPMTIADLANVFKQIHFPYNSDLIKGQENIQIIRSIASYMKKNKGTYLFIEGHCDERGAEAYNLSLGSRRSNNVRTLLVNEGVDPNQIFTVSYGKEKPLVFGHSEEAWKVNRRAEFKIYQR